MERTIKLAIVDVDSTYAERLAVGISQYSEFEISTFFSVDKFEEILFRKKYDVVLFSDNLDINLDTNGTAKVVYIPLNEENGVTREIYSGLKGIYKYQCVGNIYREILGRISLIRSAIKSGAQAFLVGVFSPAGGVGTTTIASMMALKFARRGKRVLYQNMECFSSQNVFFPHEEGGRCVSDFLAYLDSDIDFTAQIQSLLKVKEENLYYMNSFRTPNDLLDLSPDEVCKFAQKLKESGLFDYVIFDLDTGIDEKNIRLLEEMDNIAIVCSDGETATRKLDVFYEQNHIMSRLYGKIMQIDNYCSGRTYTNSAGVPQIGKIGTYQNAGFANLVDQLSKLSATDFVDQLCY